MKIDCPKLVKSSILLSIFFLVFFPSAALALSSDTINFQGKIVRNDTGFEGLNVTTGNPACVVAGNANDTCDFEVKYYSASSGGTLLLTEDYQNTEIGQYNGAFNLSLGSDGTPTAGSYATFDAMIKGVTDLYVQLGFSPAGNATYSETFSRMPMQASAYAIKAKYASGANTAFQFDSAANSSGYTSPVAGMVYYDTTDAALKVYNGSTWGGLGSGSGSLFTDGGIFTYLTALTDHFVLGSSSYTAIGADSYTTYLSGLSTRPSLSFDMTAERLTISGSQSQSGLTVYSNYASTGGWPVATFKAEDSGFDNVVMQITQDGTGNILSLQKGSTEAFAFENPLTFYIHPRVDNPTVTANRLYNVNGTLYWNGSPVGGSSSLWTDGGTFTYLTSTTDDVVIGGDTLGTAAFFFDVSTGNFGIGTSTPGAKLDIAGSNSTISNTTGDITISPDDSLVVKANDTQADNLMEWQDSTGAILSLINQNGYATFGSNTGNTGAMLSLGASTGTVAQINLAAGLDVAAPNSGDMWWNGTSLYFFDGSTSVDLLTAGGGGSNVLSNYGMVSNGTSIGVTHDTNSYDVVASGWICVGGTNNAACSGGQWKNIQQTDMTITHSLSNQWNDANVNGIIRSIVKLTDVELAPGVDVGTGADGAITVSSNTNINRTSLATGRSCIDGGDAVNYNVTAFNAGGTTATLNRAPATGCLNPGDEVLLINLQGTNTAFGNVGNYETLEVLNVSSTTVTFKTAKSKFYGTNLTDDANLGTVAGTQRVMLQRVPNYSDVTVSAGINFYPDAWATEATENATYRVSKGGVLLFRANGNVSVAGNIHANGLGFQGATTRGAWGGGDNNGRSGGAGGEAYCGAGGVGGAYAVAGGAGAAGGGSGQDVGAGGTGYCGGGGGGNSAGVGSVTAGGAGGGAQGFDGAGGGAGYGSAGTGGGGSSPGTSGGTNTSGNGGTAGSRAGGGGGGTYGTADLTKLYLGSGGGKGVDYEVAGDYLGDGGNGGGIVGIYTSSLTVSGTLKSTGVNGEANTGGTYGGGGGGGTGGSLLIAGKTISLGSALVGVSGGTGGAGTVYGGGAGGNGRIAIYNTTTYSGTTINTAQTNAYTIGYNSYGVYNSPVISTPNAQSYDNLRWDATLNTYGKISVQTRSGNTSDPTAPANSFVWTKYDSTVEAPSDTTGTNGRLPTGTSGKGDEAIVEIGSIIKDGDIYKMWYSGMDDMGTTSFRIYYATSQDGITWTKYDNTIPTNSDTTGTNGRIPLGTSGKGDEKEVKSPSVIIDNGTYKMWYSGEDVVGGNSRIYYATSPDGLTWTKYDNTIPSNSDTTSISGRVSLGTSGKGDEDDAIAPSVIKDGSTYKMWYTGSSAGGNSRIYYATSPDGLTWTKYDNSIPANSDTTSTNGRVPLGTSGKGDDEYAFAPSVIKDESTYRMWYSGNNEIYYATSSDGLIWTKYDNSIPVKSDTTGTNGRIPSGTSGMAGSEFLSGSSVLKEGDTYKVWYGGIGTINSVWNNGIYYATGIETIGSWEAWKPYTSGTNYTTLQSADTHTTFTGTNATVAEGDITRNVDYFEDEDEPLGTNITKVTSSTNGGYMESTITATNIVNYDYLTLWVRASQAGNTLRIGIGESAGTEQYEDITIDVANVWQKVYWDLSDISAASRDAITKIRLTNFSTSSNVIYLDNVKAEKLLSVNTGSAIASTPNQYFQYRIIFTTTNLSYQPQLENISLAYNSGYRIVMYDANNVRLYNYSGGNEYLRLEVVASTGAGGSGGGFVNGLAVSHVADGADAIAFQFNTSTAFTNPSSKLLSVMNNSVEKMYLDADGNLYVSGTITSGKGLGAALVNHSGGIVAERSLVTVDSSTDGAFTTTTVAGLQGALGVVQGVEINGDVDGDGVCDNGDTCLVAFEGVVDVKLDNAASSSKGDYVYSSTTAGQGHSASGTTQTNGMLGVVTSTADSGSGYVKMVFDAQNKVTADMYLNVSYDENVYRDIYNQLANDYTAMSDAERRGYLESNQSQTVMFDNFVDSLKIDSTHSTIGVDADAKKAGLWGGVTIDNSMLDIAGNRYLGSATATLLTSKYYDRTQSGLQDQDSTPATLVAVGVDPNWYKGVSLQTTSNLTTSYNGSLIGVSGVYGTGSEHGYIDLTVTGTTTTGITANIVSSDGTCTASGANLAFGSSYAFVSGSCSGSSITIKPVRSDYKNGDKFRILSWVVEPTTANDRGDKREFPERSVILASSDASNGYLTIIDVDTQRVWMIFTRSSAWEMLRSGLNNNISSISMLNGEMNLGMSGSAASGMYSVQFYNDQGVRYDTAGKGLSNKCISDRNITNTYTVVNASQALVNNTANDVSAAVIPNQPTQEMTVSGWGYVVGNGTGLVSESVNLPYKFDSIPIVSVSPSGAVGSAPTSFSSCTSGAAGSGQNAAGQAAPITTTSFTSIMASNNTTFFANGVYYCYTWTATGTVSPKQFVAVATGSSGVDGAVTIINKTQGTKADVWNGSQHANVLWASKVALTSNNVLYISGNDDTAGNNALYTYYNPASISSDATWTAQNNGYYFQGANTWKLAILGVTSANQIKSLKVTEGTSTADGKSNTLYVGTVAGVSVIQEVQGKGNLADGAVEATGSVKYYTKDYISEQMVGDIRGMWPLNYDNTSADNEDVSIKANALTATNITSADAVSGVRGTAVDFNGTDEYFYREYDTDMNLGAQGTLGAWVKTASAGTQMVIKLAGCQAGNCANDSYDLYLSGGNVYGVWNNAGTGAIQTLTSPNTINDNNWHYIATNSTGSTISLYIDGQVVASQAMVASIMAADADRFYIGAGYVYLTGMTNYFSGLIDEPMVTATALTNDQIKKIYEDGLRSLKGSHTSADTYNQLSGTSNDIRDILVTPDSKYMYVGTEGGGISKIDLTSSTRLNAYTTATDPSTSTNNIETLSGRYYPVFAGDIGSSGRIMGIDSNGNNSTGTYYSKVTTFTESTNRAFLWMTASIDPTDTSSSITVSASNDNGANYVVGTLIQTNTSGSLPEYEYSFVFPTSDKNYKVKFEIARGSSNKATTYVTKWGLSQMEMDTATVNGLFTNSNDTIANGSYLEVVHGQNTYDLVANGWVFDTSLNKWIEVTNTDNGVTQNLSNQWQDANVNGIIRSIVKMTSVELATGVGLGTGGDGDINIVANKIINTDILATGRTCADAPNYNVTAIDGTGTQFTISTSLVAGCLAAGDELLLINLRGTPTAYGNVGNYETLKVLTASGTTITTTTPKTKFYGDTLTGDTNLGTGSANQKVVLQRVPQYHDVTVASTFSLTPSAWDGSKGGIIFFRANGTVTINGSINSNGKGYLPGATTTGVANYMGSGGGESFCAPGGAAGGSGAGGAGAGGGGAGYGNYTAGTAYCGGGGGGNANLAGSATLGGAGGGASGHSSGGGGGYGSFGYGGTASGTNGGTSTSGAGANAAGSAGGGGGGTYGVADLSKLMFGSGGGSGGAHSSGATGGLGGQGGGITMISANTISVNGTLASNGGNASNYVACNSTYSYWGGGGGGAGGSVKIYGNTVQMGASLVSANAGASSLGCIAASPSYYGGNGGVGRIATYTATSLTGTSAPTYTGTTVGYNNYGIYNSAVVTTTNAQSYGNLRWDAALNTYGKISVQTRSGATADPTDGTWEGWKPNVSGTNYTTLQSADIHTDWTGTNATVAEGDITRPSIYGFEDEIESLGTNMTKATSSTNGGYMESTIAATNLTNYDYVTLWVRSSQVGNVLRIGMGESAATEQYEEITIDAANTWQKVYWDLSDISAANRDAITKLRITNFSAVSNTIYFDNVKTEKLLSTGNNSIVASTPNAYMQYRVIFTTTNLSYQPQLENITFTYSSGFKVQVMDANTVRLYNNSGKTQKMKLDIILGSAALDLRASEYTVNIAPNAAQIDGGTNTNSIWINKLGAGGNLLKLQTNSVDMMVVSSEGDMALAGDVAIGGGSLTLGTTGDQGTIRYNTSTNQIEFSNDGIAWMPLGESTRKYTLSAEYAGAVLSGDGTDNVGTMKSDNTGSGSNSMNYYEWNSSALSLNDYDVRVRFTLPSDFNGWGSTGGVKLNYATESTSNTNNKVDMYIYKEGSGTVDGTFAAGVSSSAGVWTNSTIAGTDLNECATAGDTCVFIMRMSSLSDNYVRIGDIAITYNRSL